MRAQSAEKTFSFFNEQTFLAAVGSDLGCSILPLKSLLSKYNSSRFLILDMPCGGIPMKRFEYTSNNSFWQRKPMEDSMT